MARIKQIFYISIGENLFNILHLCSFSKLLQVTDTPEKQLQMNISILKAKIKRNHLEEYAGAYFRDDTSQIINSLNAEGKCALFGIQREDGIYTIIGQKHVYYSTVLGAVGEIPLNDFSDFLHLNALKKGKRATFEFVPVNDTENLVWLHNKSIMNALWNVILWLNQ